MGNDNKLKRKDRRWFLSFFLGGGKDQNKPEMVKMLSADGKLVEVERSVLEKATSKKRSSNEEIYHWMDNPSKKD